MTTWADHYRDILSHPADDGPRLVAADWLAEFGTTQEQHEHAEFIRVQVGLANGEGDRVQCKKCDGEGIRLVTTGLDPARSRKIGSSMAARGGPRRVVYRNLDADRKTTEELCTNCNANGWVINQTALRRRESELLSAVSPETCPPCRGTGVHQKCGGYGCMDCKDGECGNCHGEREFAGPSNAVRWAGKLGDVEPFPWAEQPVWHVGWGWGRGEQRIDARFARGFIDCVSLSCAALVGDYCDLCGGSGDLAEAPLMNPPAFVERCPQCHGSGRVGGLRSELRQFPLGECVLSDKRPSSINLTFDWWDEDSPQGRTQCDPASDLPTALFDLIEGGRPFSGSRERPSAKCFNSVAAASAAMRAACCRWIREGELDCATVRTA